MIASVCDRRRDGKSSFRTLKEYLVDKLRTEDWGEAGGETLNSDGTTHLYTRSGVAIEHNGLDMDTLVQEFESVVAMKPKVEDPIYHFVVSWHEDDDPTDEQMFDTAKEAISTLGFDGHQFLNAIHRDTDNPHIHVAVSRVNPDSYKIINPYNDYYKLGGLMSQIEDRHGFKVDPQGGSKDYGRKDFDFQGDVSFLSWCKENLSPVISDTLRSPSPEWKNLKDKIADLDVELVERGGGFVFRSTDSSGHSVAVKASSVDRQFSKSKLENVLGDYETSTIESGDSKENIFRDNDDFARWAKSEISASIKKWSSRDRASWDSLHKAFEKYDCQLIRYGQGLAVIHNADPSVQVAASTVDRSLSINKLEDRLGDFKPVDKAPSKYAKSRKSSFRRKEEGDVGELKRRYQQYREKRPTPEKLRKQISKRIREVRKEIREEKKEVYKTFPPSLARIAYLEELEWTRIRKIQGERLRLTQQYNAEQALTKTLAWREWIEEEAVSGDTDAQAYVQAWHYQRHSVEEYEASVSAVAVPRNYIEVSQASEALLGWRQRSRRNGTTDYYSTSGRLLLTRQRNGLKLRDRSDATLKGAMQMAIDTYGRELRLTGGAAFKQQAIEALVSLEQETPGRKVRLSDPELQSTLDAEREKQRPKAAAPRQR